MSEEVQPKVEKSRPICVNCGRELVFASIMFENQIFNAWLCDCVDQPEGVKTDIVRAREWDAQGMIYEVEFNA